MRTIDLVLIPTLIAVAAACGGDADGESAQSTNPPVALWRPDSARAAAPQSEPEAANGDTTATSVAGQPTVRGSGVAEPPDARDPAPRVAAATGSDETPSREATTPSGAEEVLLRAERAYESVRTMRAEFVQDLTVPLLESTQRSRGEIFHRKPDRFLMRFSDPAGDIVVADGSRLWLYYPSSDPKQVVRTSMGQAGRLDLQREFLSNPTERFDATLHGSEAVDGRPAKLLTLVPRTSSPYRRVRIWIDDGDALARRFEITENNDNVRVVELRNLRVNVELSNDLFSFTPPAGAQVFDQ